MLVTLSMLLFFMVMFTVSFIMNRPLDLAGLLGFMIPMVTHTTHLISNAVSNANGGQNVQKV